jgi:integrase
LAYIRPALKWAVEKEIIDANPAEGIPDPDPRRREARSRNRYLDDDEIRLFWLACVKIGWPFGPMFQLLLLTAQRRDELAEAPWSEFTLGQSRWLLPPERTKNKKAHLVHLSPLAIGILGGLPRIGGSDFVFTTTGTSPVSGFGRARARLADAMIELTQAPIKPFTLHDLRRTATTGMAGLGIAPHIVDKVLNHTAGSISGVAAVYNRFEYLAEREAALLAWSQHIEVLTVPSNIIAAAR